MANVRGLHRMAAMEHDSRAKARHPGHHGDANALARPRHDHQERAWDPIEPVQINRSKSVGNNAVKLNERIVHRMTNNNHNSDNSLNSSSDDLHLMKSIGEKKSSHLPQRDYLAPVRTKSPSTISSGKSSPAVSLAKSVDDYYDGDEAIKSQFANNHDLDPLATERRQVVQKELENRLRRHSSQSRSSSHSTSDYDPFDSSYDSAFGTAGNEMATGMRQGGKNNHSGTNSERFLSELQDEKSPGFRKLYLPDRAFNDSIGGCLRVYEDQTHNSGEQHTRHETVPNDANLERIKRERDLLRDLVCLLYKKDLLLDEARPHVRHALQLCEVDIRALHNTK